MKGSGAFCVGSLCGVEAVLCVGFLCGVSGLCLCCPGPRLRGHSSLSVFSDSSCHAAAVSTAVQPSLPHEVFTAGVGHLSNPDGQKLLLKFWHLTFLLFLCCSRASATDTVLSCLVSACGLTIVYCVPLNKYTVQCTHSHLSAGRMTHLSQPCSSC